MSTETKKEYMLLLSSNEWYNGLSAQELEKVMSQCKAWFDRLSAQGSVKGGQALAREGAIVSGTNGRVVSDGPFAETKEAIGGYMVVQANSLQEAISIAKGNPTLAYGTKIEVRPLAEECPLDAHARQIAREENLATA
jgi:hypothetical protein